jgi:hypothetical protein
MDMLSHGLEQGDGEGDSEVERSRSNEEGCGGLCAIKTSSVGVAYTTRNDPSYLLSRIFFLGLDAYIDCFQNNSTIYEQYFSGGEERYSRGNPQYNTYLTRTCKSCVKLVVFIKSDRRCFLSQLYHSKCRFLTTSVQKSKMHFVQDVN